MKKAGFKAALTAVALVFSGLALAQGMPAPSPAPAPASPPGYDSRPEPGQGWSFTTTIRRCWSRRLCRMSKMMFQIDV